MPPPQEPFQKSGRTRASTKRSATDNPELDGDPAKRLNTGVSGAPPTLPDGGSSGAQPGGSTPSEWSGSENDSAGRDPVVPALDPSHNGVLDNGTVLLATVPKMRKTSRGEVEDVPNVDMLQSGQTDPLTASGINTLDVEKTDTVPEGIPDEVSAPTGPNQRAVERGVKAVAVPRELPETRVSSESVAAGSGDTERGLPVQTFCNAEWSSQLHERIQRFLAMNDKSLCTYSPSHFPTTGFTWKKVGEDENSNVLAFGDRPAVMWVIGEVSAAIFLKRNSEPLPRVSIALKPIYPPDVSKINAILRKLASYKGETLPEDKVWASRRQTHLFRGDRARTPYRFKACYDARESFTSKQKMDKYELAALAHNDLVLIECNISRWKCDASANTIYRGPWELWRTGLDLVSVSVLFCGPETSLDEDEEDAGTDNGITFTI